MDNLEKMQDLMKRHGGCFGGNILDILIRNDMEFTRMKGESAEFVDKDGYTVVISPDGWLAIPKDGEAFGDENLDLLAEVIDRSLRNM